MRRKTTRRLLLVGCLRCGRIIRRPRNIRTWLFCPTNLRGRACRNRRRHSRRRKCSMCAAFSSHAPPYFQRGRCRAFLLGSLRGTRPRLGSSLGGSLGGFLGRSLGGPWRIPNCCRMFRLFSFFGELGNFFCEQGVNVGPINLSGRSNRS